MEGDWLLAEKNCRGDPYQEKQPHHELGQRPCTPNGMELYFGHLRNCPNCDCYLVFCVICPVHACFVLCCYFILMQCHTTPLDLLHTQFCKHSHPIILNYKSFVDCLHTSTTVTLSCTYGWFLTAFQPDLYVADEGLRGRNVRFLL